MSDDRNRYPNNVIIRYLRDIWYERHNNNRKRNSDLANILGINSSALSAYCSEKKLNPPRRCPDWVILKMLEIMNMQVTLTHDSVLISERRNNAEN